MLQNCVVPAKGQTKFIFFSGKGGVGKSTMSCATAVWLAKQGYKTLLVTTDPAPNLSDIFEQVIGHKVTVINQLPNLWAIEINPDIASDEYRERAIAPVKDILDEEQLHSIKEQMKSPCVDEVAAFDKFIEFMDDPEYDVVVFDTAPTGHTIRLLELPSSWDREISKGGSTCIGPSESLKGAQAKYEKAISYLQDNHKTSFIFVLKAEKLSILETHNSGHELNELGIDLKALIVNGLYPSDACTDTFFKKKLDEQTQRLMTIENEFNGIYIAKFPLMSTELNGLDLLETIGQNLYQGKALPHIELLLQMPTVEIEQNAVNISELLSPAREYLTRFIFITGKGGVGKSTIACITALHMAEKGFKTLVVTTDPASHLEAIFGQPVGHEVRSLKGQSNLFAARIDQKKALEEYRARILAAVRDLGKEVETSVMEDLNSPCAEEMASFECFMAYLVPGEYQVVIFDTAPTGHTLHLLELPSDWHGYIDLGSLTKKTSDNTIREYDNVIAIMRDTRQSTFAFVMYPEYTPIMEAWRASKDLKAQVGIHTNLAIANMLLNQNHCNNAFFGCRRYQQQKYLALIKEKFPIPLLSIPLLDHEPEGLESLSQLARDIFSESTPFGLLQ